jgi:hypothetical protein
MRFQFSLRALLLLVVIVACGPATWISHEQHKSRESRRAVERILGLGGKVQFWSPPNSRSKWMKWILGDDSNTYVRLVMLSNTAVNDEDLACLKHFQGLYELVLSNTEVTDQGLRQTAELSELRTLILDNTRVTDAGLASLEELPLLCELHLQGTDITGDGLKHLRGAYQLQYLNVSHNTVDDKSLIHLQSLSQLEQLWAEGTPLTAAGIGEFKRTQPGCWVFVGDARPQ